MNDDDPKAQILNAISAILISATGLFADPTLPSDYRRDIGTLQHTASHLHSLIKDASELKDLSQASSEVRTPITGIRGYPQLMLHEPPIYHGTLNNIQREQLQKMAELGNELHNLIEAEIFHKLSHE